MDHLYLELMLIRKPVNVVIVACLEIAIQF